MIFLFRAMFWFAAVAVFMPHEPRIGLQQENAATQDRIIEAVRETVITSFAKVRAQLAAKTLIER